MNLLFNLILKNLIVKLKDLLTSLRGLTVKGVLKNMLLLPLKLFLLIFGTFLVLMVSSSQFLYNALILTLTLSLETILLTSFVLLLSNWTPNDILYVYTVFVFGSPAMRELLYSLDRYQLFLEALQLSLGLVAIYRLSRKLKTVS